MEAEPSTRSIPTKPGKIYTSRVSTTFGEVTPDRDTLPKNFLLRVRELADRVAMRKKRYGIWQEYTWNEVYRHVSEFCLGLVSLGLQAGETVAIIGDNDPEFYWAQIGAHSARAKSFGIFSDAAPGELLFAITKGEATFLVAQDQEQVDKALAIKDKIPAVRKIIYWDDQGLWNYDDPLLASFEDIEALGRQYAQSHPGLYEQLVASTQRQDIILLSMTSGTTSLPKLAMISNWRLLYGYLTSFEKFARSYSTDTWLSFSPMAWLTEQAFGFTPFLMDGFIVHFPEGPETVPTDMREVAPAGLLFPSRVWENLASVIQVRINDSSWWNRLLYRAFMPVAYHVIDLEDQEKPIPPHLRFARWLGEFAIFEPLRDKIGLTRARNSLTAGSALSPDVIRFFRAIGVELRQLYASTESAGTMHLPGDVKLASVGVVMPGVEVKIADDQEILLRTEAMFSGYFNDPESTAKAIDQEGWYHTGDAGYMDDHGHLIYLDRVTDMIELANGEKFSPQYIEGRLKFSPYIQDVMAVGGFDMHFVTCIININFENVARWAEKNRIVFTTFVDLSQKAEVYNLIKKEIEHVNATLPPAARVQKFVILHKAFDADEAELTRTRKLRRRALEQKYGQMLDAMYGNRDQVTVSAEVKYRDGRTGVVETAVKVGTL
ncbi:MAG: AMP-binding protein [Anaerolineae bacterium]|nr:AMP-binding protein [Anaerolineae bacterium]